MKAAPSEAAVQQRLAADQTASAAAVAPQPGPTDQTAASHPFKRAPLKMRADIACAEAAAAYLESVREDAALVCV